MYICINVIKINWLHVCRLVPLHHLSMNPSLLNDHGSVCLKRSDPDGVIKETAAITWLHNMLSLL